MGYLNDAIKEAEDDKTRHESFATISLSRVRSSEPMPFFGSSIMHHNFIELTLHGASMTRRLKNDWVYAETDIAKVRMSETQFAEMITHMNYGDGTPVTLVHFNGKMMEETPFHSKVEQFTDEFKEDMRKLVEGQESITEEIFDLVGGRLPKKVRNELENKLNKLNTEIKNNVPYVQKQFSEQMDKTVHEAKGEIEAHARNSFILGLEPSESNVKFIEESKNEQ